MANSYRLTLSEEQEVGIYPAHTPKALGQQWEEECYYPHQLLAQAVVHEGKHWIADTLRPLTAPLHCVTTETTPTAPVPTRHRVPDYFFRM